MKTNKIGAFAKVQGNEFNASLVLEALVSISKLVPKATINIDDEGEFLLCPLNIKNGKALPLLNEVQEDIQGYALRLIFAKDSQFNILDKLEHSKGFGEDFARELKLNNNYGELDLKHIDNKLRNLKLVEQALISERKRLNHDDYFAFYNIENLDPENWFNPFVFARKVITEDFIDTKVAPDTLMEGFNGEGFGLSTKADSEKSSYEMTAQIQKLLKATGNGSNLQILGS